MVAVKTKSSILQLMWKHRVIYTLLIPGLVWYTIFAYGPMSGLSLAFKSFRASLGIWGSPWIGLYNFENVLTDPAFIKSIWTTIRINFGRLIFQFPAPIIVALLLNEIPFVKTRKIFQTILTFPHFLSWVLISSILINFLAYNGLLNSFIMALGLPSFNFLGNAKIFVPFLYVTEIWKSSGWTAIIYLAAISGIDMEQYEAAEIDGANRLQKIFRITIPNIIPTIVVMFILTSGHLMTTGFDQIFNLNNPAVRNVSETIDMYIYRITFRGASDFGFSTAVSLFRSTVNLFLLLIADRAAKMMGSAGLIG